MDGVVCLSILLEGGVTVSNNFTKRHQNGFEIGTRVKFATHLRQENSISNEIVIYTFFLRWVVFPYHSLYAQAVAYTTYFELGEPVHETTQCGIENFEFIVSERVQVNSDNSKQ